MLQGLVDNTAGVHLLEETVFIRFGFRLSIETKLLSAHTLGRGVSDTMHAKTQAYHTPAAITLCKKTNIQGEHVLSNCMTPNQCARRQLQAA